MNDFMKSKMFGLLVIVVVAAMVGGCLYVGLNYAPLASTLNFVLQIIGAWTIGTFLGGIIGDKVISWQKSL